MAVRDVHAQVSGSDLFQSSPVRIIPVPEEDVVPTHVQALVHDAVRRGLRVHVADGTDVALELVFERGMGFGGIAVQKRPLVLLLHDRALVGQGGHDVEDREAEVGLPTGVGPDHQCRVYQIVPDAAGVEPVVPDGAEIQLHPVFEAPEIGDRESFEHHVRPTWDRFTVIILRYIVISSWIILNIIRSISDVSVRRYGNGMAGTWTAFIHSI